MRNCIDCSVRLETNNRSSHQPSIRCQSCWEKFADETTYKLEKWRDDMKPVPPGGQER